MSVWKAETTSDVQRQHAVERDDLRSLDAPTVLPSTTSSPAESAAARPARRRSLLDRLRERARLQYRNCRRAFTGVLFERRLDVQTDAYVPLELLGVDAPYGKDYMPSGWLSLRRILRNDEVTADDVLLDVGSGMGRVVLQAAIDYPFRRVLGIEVARDLHAIAMENVRRNTHRFGSTQVSLTCQNAVESRIPDDVTVAYLYNSFEGPTFTSFLEKLLQSIDRNPRQVRFIYANPRQEELLLATKRAHFVRESRGWRPTAAWARSNCIRMYVVL